MSQSVTSQLLLRAAFARWLPIDPAPIILTLVMYLSYVPEWGHSVNAPNAPRRDRNPGGHSYLGSFVTVLVNTALRRLHYCFTRWSARSRLRRFSVMLGSLEPQVTMITNTYRPTLAGISNLVVQIENRWNAQLSETQGG